MEVTPSQAACSDCKLKHVSMSGLGCGRDAALYLTSTSQSSQPSECSDFYCDANNVCGQSCVGIDIQEGNKCSWHSTLHGKADPGGLGTGIGGGGILAGTDPATGALQNMDLVLLH